MLNPRTGALAASASWARLRVARRFVSTTAAAPPPPSPSPSPSPSTLPPAAAAEPASAAFASQFAIPAPTKIDRESVLMRTYKPRTPGVRHLKRPINDHLWKGRPFLPLTFPKKGHGKGGRNNTGRVTVRHRGGGAKRRIRTVDFERWAPGPQLVERIEHDPGRSAHIALITDQATGRKSYIVAAEGMRAGDIVQSYRAGIPQDLLDSMGGTIDPGILAARTAHRGNCLPLHMVPIGTVVYNVGSQPNKGAVFCRSAGTYAVVMTKEERTWASDGEADGTGAQKVGRFVQVRLQSGEIRRVSKDACVTIGVASNPNHQYRQLGKAGRSRWLNIRPTVRGVAMNRADHPHGGGRGKSKSNRHPTSPWGTPAKGGYKTRRTHNINRWVVVPRVRNMGKRKSKGSS
ncbi:50S ribosomal protein l2 [Grosmannia clavigera kw1407]|uniref:Large ribosomal subunit protein uL2m n=1 Tax=Grosmannia clavigera (strain kw1407 / UAMH 11150) TaxID=655863 RepID=F0XMG6_GROCL|nr:50S ribosomal protein l2 [Grosmannia clavigera kw1407]EFX01164.1 50S ribosomal protein l2 [Grosmannia clavigera kw1407]